MLTNRQGKEPMPSFASWDGFPLLLIMLLPDLRDRHQQLASWSQGDQWLRDYFKHHARERELGQILDLYSAPTQDAGVLFSEPGFHVRVLCQKQEGPAERIRGGLMTRCHERGDFAQM